MDSEERYGSNEVFDLQGNARPKVFDFYFFKSRSALISKLPGLINVLKGDINLVGNSLLTHKQVESLRDEWEIMRFKAPAGLFHFWEVEGERDLTWEEKIVYYADKRVMHDKIVPLKERLEEAHKRNIHFHGGQTQSDIVTSKVDPLIFALEEEIFSQIDLTPDLPELA